MTFEIMLTEAFICACGLLLHVASKWQGARHDSLSAGQIPPGLFAFMATIPAALLVSTTATVGAFVTFVELDWMNPGAAFTIGVAGNSVAKNLQQRFEELK